VQFLNELGKRAHFSARDKGFYDRETLESEVDGKHLRIPNPSLAAEKLCLLHSEISEALDALRKGDKKHHDEELADIQIRLVDYAHWSRCDLDDEVEKKMEKNSTRPHLHGKAF